MAISTEPTDSQITQPMTLGDFRVHSDMVETRKVVPPERKGPPKLAAYALAAASVLAIAGITSAFFALRGTITENLESQGTIQEEQQQPPAAPSTSESSDASAPGNVQSIRPAPLELATESACYTFSSDDGTQSEVTVGQGTGTVQVTEEQSQGPSGNSDDVFFAAGTGVYTSATELSVTVTISDGIDGETRQDSQTWVLTSEGITTAEPGRSYERTDC